MACHTDIYYVKVCDARGRHRSTLNNMGRQVRTGGGGEQDENISLNRFFASDWALCVPPSQYE